MSFLQTAEWCEIDPGDFYKKIEIYTMSWNNNNKNFYSPSTTQQAQNIYIDLNNYVLVGSTYGGPLAIVRDNSKLIPVTGSTSTKQIIYIFSPSGQYISSIKWDSGTLLKIGWSCSEDLLCIQEDGNIFVYNIFGEYKEVVNCLVSSGGKEKAIEAEIFPSNNGTGVAYLTKDCFVVINNYKVAKAHRYQFSHVLGGIDNNSLFSSWSVLSFTSSTSKSTSIVASKDCNLHLFTINSTEMYPKIISSNNYNNSIVYIAVSLNGLDVAFYTNLGILCLGSSLHLNEKFLEVNCKELMMSENISTENQKPKQIMWCGNEAIVLSWNDVDKILLINKSTGSHLIFNMDCDSFSFIPDIDSIRVVSNFYHEFIQRIPQSSKDIFQIGSLKSSSLLVQASKEFSSGSHKSNEYIRCISDLKSAVNSCIDAASYEFNSQTQKMLLRAAQFGKNFLTKYNPEPFVQICQLLRIMNCIRDYKIAIPLTYTQLEILGVSVIIDRLILRRQYPLAIKIAEFLKLRDSQGRSRILAHWACYKVDQKHIEETMIAQEIHSKLKNDTNISYSEISQRALKANRKKLATNLAHYEVRKSVQVPLFIELGEFEIALSKAAESGDADLIYKALWALKDTKISLSDFQMKIRKHPIAQRLYIKYTLPRKPENVLQIYDQEDDFSSEAAMIIRESYESKKFETRLADIARAQEVYKKGKNDFVASLCEDQNRLLKYQNSLEQKFSDRKFIDLSLRDTLKALLVMKELKLADNLRNQFKVSEKMFFWIRMVTLAESAEWIELERLSKTKKMPVTFENFVDTCIQYNKKEEAGKYLPKVKDELKVKYYVLAGLFEEAVKVAIEQNSDESDFHYIYSKCLSTDRNKAELIKAQIENRHTRNQP